MRFNIALGLVCLLYLNTVAQGNESTSQNDMIQMGSRTVDFGVVIEDDSITISPEMIRLLTDAVYRDTLYPEEYVLKDVVALLEGRDTKRALWWLINLYEDEPYTVRAIVMKLGQIGIGSTDYINAYYSYIYGDPDVMGFSNGTPYVKHPLELETKLRSCEVLATNAEYSIKMQSVAAADRQP